MDSVHRMTNSLPPGHPAGFVFRPDKWGPSFWNVLHSVTFLYPQQNPLPQHKTLVRNFFTLIPFILPCSLCGQHLLHHMQQHPLTDDILESRDSLSRWLHEVHNIVNAQLKKDPVAYEDVYRYYMIDTNHSNVLPENSSWMAAVVVLSLLVVVLFIALMVVLKRQNDPYNG